MNDGDHGGHDNDKQHDVMIMGVVETLTELNRFIFVYSTVNISR